MVQVVYDKPAYWFVFCKDELLLQRETEGRCTVPYGAEPPVKLAEWNTVHRLTPLEGRECRAVSIDMPVVGDERYVMTGLRASYDVLPRELYLKAGKGAEILYWDKNTKFCGVCGAPMKLHTDISKRCTNCGKEVWPQLATAIIGISSIHLLTSFMDMGKISDRDLIAQASLHVVFLISALIMAWVDKLSAQTYHPHH